MVNNNTLDTGVINCIRECLDCYQICVRTKVHCLKLGGEHAQASHIALLSACAEICQLAAHSMLTESEFQEKLRALCAEACKRCAEDCAKFTEDEVMQTCSDVCKRCALACQAMAKERKERQ
jgi:hypothetical protein